MAFAITDTGIQIQTLEEIKAEWNAFFQAEYGEGFKLGEGSIGAKFVGIASEREALYQQLFQSLVSFIDPNNATGSMLDILCLLTNTIRQGPIKSKSSNFLATGIPGVVINTGRQFQNVINGSFWNVLDGPFVIGGGGTIAITAEANEAGPFEFLASGSSEWAITLGTPNWTAVEATADIDPEDVGRLQEANVLLRTRRKDELLVNGNDLDGIRAEVLRLTGVTLARTFENQNPIVVVDGIPGGAFEVVVEGGDDDAIAAAIFDNKPPGAEAFGSTNVFVTDSQGDLKPIGFTRPSDVDMWLLITCDTTGAEGALPPNAEQVVLETALAYGNENFNTPGYDVVPPAFIGSIFAALRDEQGKDSVTSVVVLASYDNGAGVAPAYPVGFPAPGAGVDPYVATTKNIEIRERADFDSLQIGVTIT